MTQATLLLLAVTGIVSLSVVVDVVDSQAVCAHCVCPPSYSPVCGYRSKTNSLRGFPSRCVLECSNKCRKNKYEFVFNGRCGKYKPSTTTEATSSTTAALSMTSEAAAYDATETSTLPPSPEAQQGADTSLYEPSSSR